MFSVVCIIGHLQANSSTRSPRPPPTSPIHHISLRCAPVWPIPRQQTLSFELGLTRRWYTRSFSRFIFTFIRTNHPFRARPKPMYKTYATYKRTTYRYIAPALQMLMRCPKTIFPKSALETKSKTSKLEFKTCNHHKHSKTNLTFWGSGFCNWKSFSSFVCDFN